jgi:hypothetical protein
MFSFPTKFKIDTGEQKLEKLLQRCLPVSLETDILPIYIYVWMSIKLHITHHNNSIDRVFLIYEAFLSFVNAPGSRV